MKNKTGFLIAVLVGLLFFVAGTLSAKGQREVNSEGKSASGASQELPISRVVLFTSGVGYFQREGVVEGNTELALYFKTKDVNDLLKSLIVQDLDGVISGKLHIPPVIR